MVRTPVIALIFALMAQTALAQQPVSQRPKILPALYLGAGALQSIDAFTTIKGLQANAVEANPMMRAIVKQPAMLIAVKSAVVFSSISLSERLWKTHHRGAAIALMAVSNGAMTAVAIRNASVYRSLNR